METAQIMDTYNRLVAKCWSDPAFKARLLANPADTLKAEGVELPAGIEFKIVENTPSLQYWVLPVPPKEVDELDDEQLSRISGGSGVYPPHWTPQMIQDYHNSVSRFQSPGGGGSSNGAQFSA